MTERISMHDDLPSEIIKFTREKDFEFVRVLGQGACGRTVLLHDSVIDESFVCKKYAPFYAQSNDLLFQKFVDEIKILHFILHKNIVCVFNYYIYLKKRVGYILMEFIDGTDIESYCARMPHRFVDIFLQAVSGFSYLESKNILHRDIRPLNIMVTDDGILKIIDFGFGKKIAGNSDFDKSISLNWWCALPLEFDSGTYNFSTEVYFVGKLFKEILEKLKIEDFPYFSLINHMCQVDPSMRAKSFVEIERKLSAGQIGEVGFSETELEIYRDFANALSKSVSKIESLASYVEDVSAFQQKLEVLYQNVMLEEWLPTNRFLAECILVGKFYFFDSHSISTMTVKNFLHVIRSCSSDKRVIIFNNLITRMQSLPRYMDEDDIPF